MITQAWASRMKYSKAKLDLGMTSEYLQFNGTTPVILNKINIRNEASNNIITEAFYKTRVTQSFQ